MADLSRAGRYEILERIGGGGFGAVYKGRDPLIKRLVAIKTCTSADADVRRRFLREAEVAGSLQHPNVTLLIDFGYEDGVPYLVQEFLDGVELQHLIDESADVDLKMRFDYLMQAARGLQYAHSKGVLHRDIKPSNLMLVERDEDTGKGTVKVLDFGIAKVVDDATKLTQTGITIGTPGYLAPEQLRGSDVGPRADIYSFGVVAFELLTYQRMYDADTISALFYQILHDQGRRLADVWKVCPDELDAFLRKCTASREDARFSSFTEVLAELQKLSESVPDLVPEESDAVATTMVIRPEVLEDAMAEERLERIDQARIEVESHIAQGDLDAAETALDAAQGRFGSEVAPLRTLGSQIASLRAEEAARARQAAEAELYAAVRGALSEGRLDEAVRTLETARESLLDPRSGTEEAVARAGEELDVLSREIEERREQLEQERRRARQRVEAELRKLVASGDLDAAETKLEEVRARLGNWDELDLFQQELGETRLQRELEQGLSKIREHLSHHRFDEAEILLEETRSQVGRHAELDELEQTLERQRREQEQETAALEEALTIGSELDAGRTDEAERLLGEVEASLRDLGPLQTVAERIEARREAAGVVEEVRGLLEGGARDAETARSARSRLEDVSTPVATELEKMAEGLELRGRIEEIEAELRQARVVGLLERGRVSLEAGELEQAMESARTALQDVVEGSEEQEEARRLFDDATAERERRLEEERVARARSEAEIGLDAALGAAGHGWQLRKVRRQLETVRAELGSWPEVEQLETRLTEAESELPPRPPWLLPASLAAVLVAVVLAVGWWLSRPGTPQPARLIVTAQPWGRVVEVAEDVPEGATPVAAGFELPQTTPVALALPPGSYTLVVEPGPESADVEAQRLVVEVADGEVVERTIRFGELDAMRYFEQAGWAPAEGSR